VAANKVIPVNPVKYLRIVDCKAFSGMRPDTIRIGDKFALTITVIIGE
jgi:hypothetical protein